MTFKVYMLKSLKDGSFYTGITENLQQRISAHNSGSSIYSKNKRPYKLVWYCVFNDKSKAARFEKYLKQGSGFAFARKHLV
ncbi:GIY-YIG nuclease family protein [Candidatus Parcubacteria bacterium]|nr:GIY-YIG nuclease family protein [Candidatus Parcubacteria bacterium]